MIILPEVLECCTTQWQDHEAIAKNFDSKFPPRWYSVLRHFRHLIRPDRPSVNLHFLLDLAVTQGKLERRVQTTCCSIFIVKDAEHSNPLFLYRLKKTETVCDPLENLQLPVLQAA